MEAQEIFDTVVNHLRTQGVRALDSDGNCQYHCLNGNTCAIGCLMTDEEYNKDMEGVGILSILCRMTTPYSLKVKLGNNDGLLFALQYLHDKHPIEKWEDEIKFIAKTYGLIYTPKV